MRNGRIMECPYVIIYYNLAVCLSKTRIVVLSAAMAFCDVYIKKIKIHPEKGIKKELLLF